MPIKEILSEFRCQEKVRLSDRKKNGNQIQSQDEKISQEKGKDYVFLE